MPQPELLMTYRLSYEVNPAFLPLSETDREGVAATLTEAATLLLARAAELRKGEGVTAMRWGTEWPTIR